MSMPGTRRRRSGPGCRTGAAFLPGRPCPNVMKCHVRHARGAYSGVRSGMTPSFRATAPDIPSGSDICLSSAQLLSPGPVSPLPRACGGVPVLRAFRVRARAGVGAGAVRAPDCARETAHAPLAPAHAGGFFGPQPVAFCRNAERRPRKPPLSTFIIHHTARCQAHTGTKNESAGGNGARIDARRPSSRHAPSLPKGAASGTQPGRQAQRAQGETRCAREAGANRRPAPERGSRGPASVLAAVAAVEPARHRLRRHREPWMDPGSGSGVTIWAATSS